MRRSDKKLSLAKRQKRFIFGGLSAFKPVAAKDFCPVGNVLEALEPITHYLKHFRAYQALDAELYSGALLYGPTGTGKTHAACFLATETDASFVDVREFPRTDKDDDAFLCKDLHALFALSRKFVKKTARPIVLFWDQFDAFLRDGSKEAKEALNQLYIELDGVHGSNNGIFIVAVTTLDPENDFDGIFDAQLLRKGRLGLRIRFTHPTRQQQIDLLKHYLGQKPHEPVDCEALVCLMTEPTPATIRDVVGEAYREACRRKFSARSEPLKVTEQDLIRALVRNMQGCSLALDRLPGEKRNVALHELGHALVAHALGRPVQMISLLPADDGLGKTYSFLPWDHQPTEKDIQTDIAIAMGGLAAEEFFGFSAGHSVDGDLENCTELAKNFIANSGKGHALRRSYGPIVVRNSEKLPVSHTLIKTMEKDIARLLKQEHRRAARILRRAGKSRMRFMAEAMLKKDPPIVLQKEFNRLRTAPMGHRTPK